MSRIRILRLETEDGRGPYANGSLELCVIDKKKSPTPSEDPKLRDQWYDMFSAERHFWFFGFETLESLQNWFSEEARDLLKMAGVNCYMYSVKPEDLRVGSFQVIFKKAKAYQFKKQISF